MNRLERITARAKASPVFPIAPKRNYAAERKAAEVAELGRAWMNDRGGFN